MADVELQINVPAMKQAMAISRQQVFSKGAYIYTVVLPESLEVMLMNHMLSQSDGWVHMESFKGKLCMYLDEIRVRFTSKLTPGRALLVLGGPKEKVKQ